MDYGEVGMEEEGVIDGVSLDLGMYSDVTWLSSYALFRKRLERPPHLVYSLGVL